ncbi:MAG: ABC transporter permease [Bacillaceae bacterium]|nr:ABC transporter permease [Bacillaceae bacterium]
MQVFKAFSKIVSKKFLGTFMIYTMIFLGLAIFFSRSGATQVEDAFELSKVRVSVINEDNTALANGLENYMNDMARPVEIDEENIKDALFFRQTEFIVTIPEGFQESFTSSNDSTIQTMSVPGSASSQFARTLIDRYLNTAKLYTEASPELSFDAIHEKVVTDISAGVHVSFLDKIASSNMSNLSAYFNFLSYIFMAMFISMVGRIMLIFNHKEIKMRNYCAPMSINHYNYQLVAGNLSLALIVWLIFVVFAFVINDGALYETGSYLYIVNSFVLTVLCLSISFLVATFATKTSIDPIGNCISLGLSFLGGSFVPQALLSDTLKTTGNFNPIFWYVKVNDTIGTLTAITQSTLQPIIYGIFVQLAFAVAFLAIALVIIKQRRYAHQ